MTKGIDMYPLAMYDGIMKQRDWRTRRSVRQQRIPAERRSEQLRLVLNDAPPFAGETAWCTEMLD